METRALAGIRERLLTPESIGRFAVVLQRELAEASRVSDTDGIRAETDLADTRARIAKLVGLIEEDNDAPRSLTARLKELETDEHRLEQVVAAATPSPVVRLPTNYKALYVRAIAERDMHLAADDGAAARQTVRPLIEKILVQPGSARGCNCRPIQLHGDLYRMLEFASAACWPNTTKPRFVGGAVVKGGCGEPHQPSPTSTVCSSVI